MLTMSTSFREMHQGHRMYRDPHSLENPGFGENITSNTAIVPSCILRRLRY